MSLNRRSFTAVAGATMTAPVFGAFRAKPSFEISLAQWSLHRTIYGGKLDNMGFPEYTKKEFGIEAVEYVNQFFKDKAEDMAYLKELKSRCDDLAVKSVLIMCDGEGQLGDADEGARTKAVENHYRWITAAQYLGCHSIRVNASSSGNWAEQMMRAADGLRRLSEFGEQHGINVLVENHGGLSSNGMWLHGVMRTVDHPRCGTLPDFGNFTVSGSETYDRYKGVEELMPYAKAVSAKSRKFDLEGNESETNFVRMMDIVKKYGYSGYVGIEWEGSDPSEQEGIMATKNLLEKIRST